MKIISLDIGNVHTGIAYADDLGFIAIPYKSVATHELKSWLSELINQEPIDTIVVGLPTTLKGTESQQTKMVKVLKEELAEFLKQQLSKNQRIINWVLFDERFTSKEAQKIMRLTAKKRPTDEHAIAAAIVLQTYLESRRM